jgi:peptidoglycan/LPS O-acetylase OafA/YrhL
MILLNGTIIVDTFFLISGFLSCYLMLLELDKKKKVNVPLLYAYRYIRYIIAFTKLFRILKSVLQIYLMFLLCASGKYFWAVQTKFTEISYIISD